MKYVTKIKLAAIHQWCDAQDKSTEFMIASMIAMCKMDHDAVMAYLQLGDKEHERLRKDVNEIVDFFAQFEELET